LSDGLRQSYSDVFHRVCREHPHDVIRHKTVQKLFEKAAADTSCSKFEQSLRRALSAVLPQALAEEDGRNWVAQRLYPILVKKMEDEKARAASRERMKQMQRAGMQE